MSDKQKHLEFIQNAISRMAANSFMLKAWTVLLVSALFAFFDNPRNRWLNATFSRTLPVFYGVLFGVGLLAAVLVALDVWRGGFKA